MRLLVPTISAILIFVGVTSASAEYYKRYGRWEVVEPLINFPPGARSNALVVQRQLDMDDLNLTEYSPKLEVTCSRGATGPYDNPRVEYKSLKASLTWIAIKLPQEFESIQSAIVGQGPLFSIRPMR